MSRVAYPQPMQGFQQAPQPQYQQPVQQAYQQPGQAPQMFQQPMQPHLQNQPADPNQLRAIFGNLKTARLRVDGNYERAGRYIERIDKIKYDRSFKQDQFIAIEKTVIRVIDNDQGRGHQVGESITHMLMVRHPNFAGNFKAFIMAALGLQESEVEVEAAVAVCLPAQPLTGLVLECHNHLINTRAGTPFTVVNYKQEIPPEVLLQILTPVETSNFFPNDYLQKVVAERAKRGMQTPGAAVQQQPGGAVAVQAQPIQQPPVAVQPVQVEAPQKIQGIPQGYGPPPSGYCYGIQNNQYVLVPN